MHWIALQSPPETHATGLTDPLTALGWWALQFTPKVALLPDAVLLEVSASERLWGGRAALLRRIYTQNKPVALCGYARAATSLVALGRLYAAQAASTAADDLPLSALVAARAHLPTFMRLGCSNWGQLRALPRDGLARRFGAALLDALDQAYGERPDSYPWLTLPDVFEARLELPSQIDSAPALLFGARRLLAQLQVWLQLRQLGVLAIELGWHMDARRNTDKTGALSIRSAQASTGTAHLQRLLGERLAQVMLPAPVHTLSLRSLQTCPLASQSASLLPDDLQPGDSLTQTIERLSARLGADHVLRLQARVDHRPEHRQAWVNATYAIETVAVSADDKRATGKKSTIKTALTASRPKGTSVQTLPKDWASALYPTWLLAAPLPLALHQQQPHYQGALTLLAGPQRLEAGWWPQPPDSLEPSAPAGVHNAAAGAALRDYFVARNPQATLLWIYRERLGATDTAGQPGAWYLHGIFA